MAKPLNFMAFFLEIAYKLNAGIIGRTNKTKSSKYLSNLLCRISQTINRIGSFRNVIRLLLIIIILRSECSRNSALHQIVFFLADKSLFTHQAFYWRNIISFCSVMIFKRKSTFENLWQASILLNRHIQI